MLKSSQQFQKKVSLSIYQQSKRELTITSKEEMMEKIKSYWNRGLLAAILLAFVMCLPRSAFAHCDTMDGPVVVETKAALEIGDVTPVLKWVDEKHEAEIRELFQKTLAVRALGPEAKDVADMHFMETLVRIHRAGEGAPYTGLKPAGSELDPAVVAADVALESGSVDTLVEKLTGAAAAGIRERFSHALEGKKHDGDSIDAGRKFVEAYVEYVHYVERIHLDIKGQAAHHGH
jgi:hypothetical protein